MKLHRDMSLDDFRDEVQIRVCRHAERSRPVREALRFARQHPDPAFYQVASNKVDAQRQFRHEVFGPTRWQRFVDFLSGTPKDVSVTVLLTLGVLIALSIMRARWLDPSVGPMDDIDVVRLADRMGSYITRHSPKTEHGDVRTEAEPSPADRSDDEIALARIDAALAGTFNDIIERSQLGEVATRRLAEELNPDDLRAVVVEQLQQAFSEPEVRDALLQQVTTQIDEIVTARVAAEVSRVADTSEAEAAFTDHINDQLVRFDREVALRTEALGREVEMAVSRGIESAELDELISARIELHLARLDEEITARLQDTSEPISTGSESAVSDSPDQTPATPTDPPVEADTDGVKGVETQAELSTVAADATPDSPVVQE